MNQTSVSSGSNMELALTNSSSCGGGCSGGLRLLVLLLLELLEVPSCGVVISTGGIAGAMFNGLVVVVLCCCCWWVGGCGCCGCCGGNLAGGVLVRSCFGNTFLICSGFGIVGDSTSSYVGVRSSLIAAVVAAADGGMFCGS